MAEEKREDPGQALRAKSMAEYAERMKGKPTPTQAENDRAALGEHILEHEADGSPVEENLGVPPAGAHGRAMESGRSGSYQTRQATPPKPAT